MGISYWPLVQTALMNQVGAGAYKNWIAPLDLTSVNDDVAQLEVPTNYIGDYVQRSYGDQLLRELAKHQPDVRRLQFITNTKSKRTADGTDRTDNQHTPPQAVAQKPRAGAALNPRFRFENFVIGASNELAYAAARRVIEGEELAFNPLFLHSATGLGKTHLMHAIAWDILAQKPHAKVLYLTAEQFMFSFVQALRSKDTHNFKEMFRKVDILMVDDVQFIVGKESTQEEFFHTFNAVVDQGKQIILAGNRSPFDMDGLDERIKSRMQMGLVVDIQPADYELRLAILRAKMQEHSRNYADVSFEDGVLEFIAQRISSNTRVLEGALARLFAFGSLIKRPISIETCNERLGDILRASDREVSIDDIMHSIGQHYSVSISDLISPRRSRSIARPRQIAMFLCKEMTSKSLPEIGHRFGKRDHTTVIHAIKKVEALLKQDQQTAKDMQHLKQILRH